MRFLEKYRGRLANMALWLLVLLPVVASLQLVRKHSVDQRFLDDWAWARDIVKYETGTPQGGTTLLHDLFSVHLEHRPAVPRILTLLVTVAAHGDVRAQLILTFLFVSISFSALCWLWLRRSGATVRDAWLPLLLTSAVMFSPVQWQMLLWPVCVGTVMPMLFLMLSFCAAFLRCAWWWRCLAGTGLAALAILSFASGTLVWVLPLPVYLLCGEFSSYRERCKFLAMWFAVLAVTLFFYFQVQIVQRGTISEKQTHLMDLPGNRELIYDLHNEALPQYAYHQGEENTMALAVPYFLSHPREDLNFVAIFCGAFTVRGWAATTTHAAMIVGYLYLAGLAGLAFLCWHWREEKELMRSLVPMLCLGAYTPVTGLMVAVGRVHAGHLGAALNTRYHAHQTQVILGLAGAAFFLGRHVLRSRPASSLRSLGWISGGALAGIVGVGWIFGASMMDAWRAARLRNQAAQFLSQILATHNHYVSWVAGSYVIARDVTDALDRQHLMQQRPLRDTQFSTLLEKMYVSDRTLLQDRALVRRLTKDAHGGWYIDGYACLPVSLRPADGVIVAYRMPGGEWKIWGFTQPSGEPMYLAHSLGKDVWGIVPGREPFPPRLMCQMGEAVATSGADPPAGAQISFWAMDMVRHALYRIARSDKDSSLGDGLPLEELARDKVTAIQPDAG